MTLRWVFHHPMWIIFHICCTFVKPHSILCLLLTKLLLWGIWLFVYIKISSKIYIIHIIKEKNVNKTKTLALTWAHTLSMCLVQMSKGIFWLDTGNWIVGYSWVGFWFLCLGRWFVRMVCRLRRQAKRYDLLYLGTFAPYLEHTLLYLLFLLFLFLSNRLAHYWASSSD